MPPVQAALSPARQALLAACVGGRAGEPEGYSPQSGSLRCAVKLTTLSPNGRASGSWALDDADETFVARLQTMGPEPYYMPSAPFAAFVAADIPVWAEHARIAGITPQ